MAAVPLLAWPAAAVVGLSLGLLGSGGSILTVPLFQMVGTSFDVAVSSSFPVVGLVAAAGMAAHARGGRVRLRRAMPFAAASVVAAFAAQHSLAPLLPARTKAFLFAGLMVVVAWRMAFGRVPREEQALAGPSPPLAAAWGLATGAMTGLLGVGGGFLIVPALVLLLRFDVRQAVGTSLLVISANCASSLLANRLSQGSEIRWDLVAVFSVAGVLGVVVGSRLAHRLPQSVLRRAFAVAVLATAAWLFARAA
jgi:uncharacterized membrane protein YfcA